MPYRLSLPMTRARGYAEGTAENQTSNPQKPLPSTDRRSICRKVQYSAWQDGAGVGVGRGTTRVAIYARVSTGERTPELQLRELRDYAGRRKRTPTPSDYIASIWS
jgi:hypothetical protein